jgi:hypothetical protein
MAPSTVIPSAPRALPSGLVKVASSQANWPLIWAPSSRASPVHCALLKNTDSTVIPSALRASPSELVKVASVQLSWPPMWAPGNAAP